MSDLPIIIDPVLCKGCKKCITACPFDALEMQGKLAVLKADECRACNACVKVCPFKAISSAPEKKGSNPTGLAAFKDIWVFAEQHDGKVQEVAYELLSTLQKNAAVIWQPSYWAITSKIRPPT
jgi:ferredoxin